MRAALLYGKEDIRLGEVPDPSPGPGQVKVRVAYAGICGSDLHSYYVPEANPYLARENLPEILGHEFAGTVVEVGDGVTELEIGDRGAVFPVQTTCGECPACEREIPAACPRQQSMGTNVHQGGLSEYVVIDVHVFHRLPENVDLRCGALVEPMAVGWRGFDRSGVGPGGTVLILGAGPIGIGAWYAFRANGIDQVLVSEPSRERREAIENLGATVIDPTVDDVTSVVGEFTSGRGVDAVIDAAGVGPALTQGVDSLAVRGRAVALAVHERPLETFQPTSLMLSEKEMVGAVGHHSFDEIIDTMSRGVYDTTGWVTERSLDDVVEALHDLRAGASAKILLRID